MENSSSNNRFRSAMFNHGEYHHIRRRMWDVVLLRWCSPSAPNYRVPGLTQNLAYDVPLNRVFYPLKAYGTVAVSTHLHAAVVIPATLGCRSGFIQVFYIHFINYTLTGHRVHSVLLNENPRKAWHWAPHGTRQRHTVIPQLCKWHQDSPHQTISGPRRCCWIALILKRLPPDGRGLRLIPQRLAPSLVFTL